MSIVNNAEMNMGAYMTIILFPVNIYAEEKLLILVLFLIFFKEVLYILTSTTLLYDCIPTNSMQGFHFPTISPTTLTSCAFERSHHASVK